MRVAPFGAGRLAARHLFEVDFSTTRNRPGNGMMITGMFDYSFGLYRIFRLPCKLKLLGGGELSTNVGGIYNLRNSNNPAAAKASVNAGVSGMAVYTWRVSGLSDYAPYSSLYLYRDIFLSGTDKHYYECSVSGIRRVLSISALFIISSI